MPSSEWRRPFSYRPSGRGFERPPACRGGKGTLTRMTLCANTWQRRRGRRFRGHGTPSQASSAETFSDRRPATTTGPVQERGHGVDRWVTGVAPAAMAFLPSHNQRRYGDGLGHGPLSFHRSCAPAAPAQCIRSSAVRRSLYCRSKMSVRLLRCSSACAPFFSRERGTLHIVPKDARRSSAACPSGRFSKRLSGCLLALSWTPAQRT